MTAIRGMSVFGLVVLLAAATAAADLVSISQETIPTGVIDTLAASASPAAMAAKCQDMTVLLRECGRINDTVLDLVWRVNREQKALRAVRPRWQTYLGSGLLGWLLGSIIGGTVGEAIRPTTTGYFGGPDLYVPCIVPGGGFVGGAVGCAAGPFAGLAVGAWRHAGLIATHRRRVNDLVRRVNLAVVTAP